MSDWHEKTHEERVEALLDTQAEQLANIVDALETIASAIEGRRRLENTVRVLHQLAEQIPEHAYQELASALEA